MAATASIKRTKSQAAGVFRADEAYSFAELRRRGFGAAALREMQRNGLPARRLNKTKIVLGSDLLDFFQALPIESLQPRKARNDDNATQAAG